ncbi:MAG: GTP-binding protein, partial [Bacteroidota bacterium]|nr:GTP-binding protein [Bacteroidota bacterium]
INIIDTPGHSDFGGEVERVLNMADGVLLVVDAFEGPMPQTRFVLQKALELNLKPIVVINKVDKPNCKPDEIQEAVFDLMFSLDATEEQLDFPTVYGSSKQGWMSEDWKNETTDVSYLLDTIVKEIPAPKAEKGILQMQISSLDYSSYVGRIAVGRIVQGSIKVGDTVSVSRKDGSFDKSIVKELYLFEGLGKVKIKHPIDAGEICAVLVQTGFDIGDTITDAENPKALPRINVDAPTMSMLFTLNNSPFFGKEGKFITSRQVRDRLLQETEKNLALKVEETESADKWIVFGRGIMHLSVLIETMRREGFEFQIGQPQVVIKEIDGVKHEPTEYLTVTVPEELSSKVIDIATKRKGEILQIETKSDRLVLDFSIPSRGLIGITNPMLTATKGEAVISHRFKAFEPWKGNIEKRRQGSLIAMESGKVLSYALDKLQSRGKFFIDPIEQVYEGQVVGEHVRDDDLVVNVIKAKKQTNVRAASADDKVAIAPAVKMSLEQIMEYIKEDEYVELTPKSIRMRKILLKEFERKREAKK